MTTNSDNKNYSRRINITLPPQIMEQLDILAGPGFIPRSVIIRQALVEFINKPENIAKLGPKRPRRPGEDPQLEAFLKQHNLLQ